MSRINFQALKDFIYKTSDNYVEDLKRFLRQPSVSARGEGVEKCAYMLANFMEKAGFNVEIWRIDEANPVVFGEAYGFNPKTLLMYGHYDVQPPEPLEKWDKPPFEAAEAEHGKIVARGASDSKGNVMAIVKAIESHNALNFNLPLNLKVIFEGEEEIGSPNLPKYIETYRKRLKADATVCFDGGLDYKGRPGISLGLKGILYVELRCKTAKTDGHSSLAPLIENPAWRLIKALKSLKDENGRILIEGWYDDVKVPTEEDIRLLEEISEEDHERSIDELRRHFGVENLLGNVEGLEAIKKLMFEPTCNIAGLCSGYTGPGSKTVLPSEAYAKIDFRLVYDQNPSKLFEKLKMHVETGGFRDIEIKLLSILEPSKTPASAPIVKAVKMAAEKIYGVKPQVAPMSSGSGPDYLFTKRMGFHSLWTGCAPPFSNAHAPNEFITKKTFLDGILYVSSIMDQFASI
jgi:acetylornithine deacetylase/succinyl-diaminopimelate desuccinylase-like protein